MVSPATPIRLASLEIRIAADIRISERMSSCLSFLVSRPLSMTVTFGVSRVAFAQSAETVNVKSCTLIGIDVSRCTYRAAIGQDFLELRKD